MSDSVFGDVITNIGNQQARRENLSRRVKVYENDWDDILNEELHRQFVPETWDNIKLMLDTSQNIFRRIVREICTVYKTQCTRDLTLGEESIENDRWEDLQESLHYDWMMAEAHRLSKAASISFLRVRYVESSDELALEILTPDLVQVDFENDNPMAMKGFGYFTKLTDRHKRINEVWVYYTKEMLYYLTSDGRIIRDEQMLPEGVIGEQENIYGVIPVVPFHCVAPTKSFWRENYNKDAYRANLIIGVLQTYLNFLVKTQSFKQLYFTGDTVPKALINSISDPLFPLALPDGTTAGVLDLNTRLEAIDALIRSKVSAIANNYGISNENFTISGNVASGFSLRVANRALEEIRDADKPLCLLTEQQLFEVVRTVNNTVFADPARKLPEDAEMHFNPGEIAYPPTWEEEQGRWEFEWRNGVSNQIDYLIARDPDLSREEAIDKLVAIQEENRIIKPRLNIAEALFGNAQSNQGFPAAQKYGSPTNGKQEVK